MKTKRTTLARASALGLSMLVVAIALAGGSSASPSPGGQSDQSQPSALPSDPWQVGQLITPESLSASLSEAAAEKPVMLYVGYPVLYQGGHITGSIFAGPGSKPDGLKKLKQEAKDLSRDKPIVLYCGCCPWKDCPNLRPAFRTLEELGFKNVKVLYVAKNLLTNWIAKGFPTQKSDDAK